MRISLETFFKKYKKAVKNNGKATNNIGNIRFTEEDSTEYCPVTLVCMKETGEFFLPSLFVEAGQKIGLSSTNANLIAEAADDILSSVKHTRVRKKLMKFANLKDDIYS